MPNQVAEQPEREPTPIGPLVERRRPSLPSLPIPLTTLIGRSAEIARVRTLLAAGNRRLVTLVGPGGVGKTRVALQVAIEKSLDGADVAFVPLAATDDPTQVAAAIGGVVDARLGGDRPAADVLKGAIGSWRILLVLDNVEQVLAAGSLLVELLSACPHLTLLITSRARLRVTGEHVVEVPPLQGPDPKGLPALDQVVTYDAVRLFVERAQATNDAFVLSMGNAAAVAGICRRLDGLPLAIELAAARSTILDPAALLARLERRLPLLSGGPQDQPGRLQTMRAAIGWSYDLLDPSEQALFRRLAVFSGGFTLEAAECMGRGVEESRGREEDLLLESVSALVDRSLIQPRQVATGGTRFGMLETLREYALEELAGRGELPVVRRGHATYFLELAERAGAGLTGPRQATWLECLETEHDNLRAGLGWALEQDDAETALRFGVGLWQFWAIRGHWSEGRGWLERGLAAGGAPDHLRARASFALGWLALVQGDLDRSVAVATGALCGLRAAADSLGAGQALLLLGRATQRAGHTDAARRHFTEAQRIFDALGDQRWVARVLHNLGLVAYDEEDYDGATALFEDALGRWRELGYTWGLATCIPCHLADIARARGDVGRAVALYRESLVLNREQGEGWEVASLLAGLLVGIAAIAVGWDAVGAGRLLGAVEALREGLDGHITPRERREAERTATENRRALGERAFAEATRAGSGMALSEAMAEAEALLAGLDGGQRSMRDDGRSRVPGVDLSPRELDVLRLVIEGLTDKEIADRLAISRRTVSKHVQVILGKLGVPSRTAAATYATRRGLG